MDSINIENYKIGTSNPPFIIAEAGVNHNGDIQKAFKMIELAKNSGATAIKFQTFNAKELIADPNLTYSYTSQGKEITESMLEMFERYQFTREQWFQIKNKCDEEKIIFLSSPSSKSDLDLLIDLGIKAIKVGSDDFTSIPLLKEYSTTGLPLILSCGMSNLKEIKETVNSIQETNDNPIILLLCTSEYPTPSENVNLLKFNTLHDELQLPLGFSDHTQGSLASSLAVSFGAEIIEKHFTYNKKLSGPDHFMSLNENELFEMVKNIRMTEKTLGRFGKFISEDEKKNLVFARKSIFANEEISKGDIFNEQNLIIKRSICEREN